MSSFVGTPSGTARGTAFAGGSLVELLRFRSRVQPDDRAFVFLRDGAGGQRDQRNREPAEEHVPRERGGPGSGGPHRNSP